MTQKKYLRLSHFVPEGHAQVHPGMSDEVRAMMPKLIQEVLKGWTKIPGHDNLEMMVQRTISIPILAFKKNGKEVLLHIFCNEFFNPINAVQIVSSLYTKYKLGHPAFAPDEPNWMHTIPLPGSALSEAETILTHQIAQSFFWFIHHDIQRHGLKK